MALVMTACSLRSDFTLCSRWCGGSIFAQVEQTRYGNVPPVACPSPRHESLAVGLAGSEAPDANNLERNGNHPMREILAEVAVSGILAPSADNQHVFKIEFGDSFIRLWPTAEYAAATALYRRVLGLISLGAVVENMRLRAAELGCNAVANWSDGTVKPLVQLDLTIDNDVMAEDLAASIPRRHTNRRMYHGPRLSQGEMQALSAAADAIEGVRLIWLTGAARRRALRMIWQAESERFLRKNLHQEVYSSIRFDLGWSERADWALPPGALEIELPMRPLFKALRHWTLMRPLTWAGVHHLIGMRAGLLPAWQAPALALLTTNQLPIAGASAIGRALERVWLCATLREIALQPLAASTILPLQTCNDLGMPNRARARFTESWAAVAPGSTPLMVIRLGRAKDPTVSAGRQKLEAYLK